MKQLIVLVTVAFGALVFAQDEPVRLSNDQLETQAYALAMEGDFAAALPLFQEMARRQPDSFVPHYNVASSLARLDRVNEALDSLDRALELGFDDLAHLTHDPDLEALRDTDRFRAIVDGWPTRMEGLAEARFEALHERFGGSYHVEEDAFLRLRFAVGLPKQSFDLAHRELDVTCRWAVAEFFGNLVEAEEAMVPWVSVVVPSDRDFGRWVAQRHGVAARTATRQIAGTYDHDKKQLVCKDLGATLRHEVFHALHYRSQSLEGQRHATWVLEGLACLVEDIDIGADGTPSFAPSWRTNIVKKAHRGNGLRTLEQLAAMPDQRFVSTSQLLHYGHARAIMLYLVAAGKLGEFYQNYVETWDRDRTAVQALERTFGATIDQIDTSFRRWIERLPVAPEQNHPPIATLGIDVDGERGEGLAVLRVVRGAPGQRAGVRQRDVIVAVNHQGTRDLNELYRVVGRYVPGDTVVLTLRRGRQMLELPARLGSRRDFDTIRIPGG